MNSTVYDTDTHGFLELDFVLVIFHPCEDAMSHTSQFSRFKNLEYPETSGMEAWHEDKISYPLLLIYHVD